MHKSASGIERADGKPLSHADEIWFYDTGEYDFTDSRYADVFSSVHDARAYADRHVGTTYVHPESDCPYREWRTSWFYPDRMGVYETVDDVIDACSVCDDDPDWHTTGPHTAVSGWDYRNMPPTPVYAGFDTVDDADVANQRYEQP